MGVRSGRAAGGGGGIPISTFAKSRTVSGPRSPEIYLAAFGKHPGWNDHIDDLGLETERLIAIKRVLYLEGIGAAIDSGAWEKLDESQRTEGFDHLVIWRTRGELTLCRLWSSSDGKGRTRYPMVVCVQCAGVPVDWALREVLPRLERVRAECSGAASAAQVGAVMDAARRELRDRAGLMPMALTESASTRVVAALAEAPEMGPGGEGLHRIMYQIEREMADYAPLAGEGGSKVRSVKPRPQQMRVPACGDTPAAVASLWLEFLLAQLDRGAPMVVVVPVNQRWADLIVGEVEGSQFFCIRASPKALPLATEIPYTLDAPFLARCRKRIEEARAATDESSGATEDGAGRGKSVWTVMVSKLVGLAKRSDG